MIYYKLFLYSFLLSIVELRRAFIPYRRFDVNQNIMSLLSQLSLLTVLLIDFSLASRFGLLINFV